MNPLVFNLLMGVVDALALWLFARNRRWPRLAGTLFVAFLLSAIGYIFIDRDIFLVMRLLAWAGGLHAPLLLFGAAWLLHRPLPTSRPRLATASLATGLFLVAAIADALWIEPHWLEVARYTVSSPKLDRKLKVALLADYQTDEIGDYERDVLRRTMTERPDLILFAGDYLQVYSREVATVRREFQQAMREAGVSAPLGVYAVKGDVERKGDRLERAFEGLNVKVIAQTTTLDLGPLSLTALSIADSANVNMTIPARTDFHLVVGHRPDYALGTVDADLLLAGHTHGGQIRLPLIGPLMTLSHVPRAWAEGETRLEGGRTLVVSRGIGLERGTAPRVRFLCRPQLVIISLEPGSPPSGSTGSAMRAPAG